jgi:hypothetical protein
MISRKRISLALAALVLVVLSGAGSAFAATSIQFNVTTANPFVANTGRSEVLGQVTLTADISCGDPADTVFCNGVAGTIQVLYVGTPIDNRRATANSGLQYTNGIDVCESIAGGALVCNADGTYINAASATMTVTNTSAGGVVSFAVKAVDLDSGDQIIVRGVRGQIDKGPGSVPGTSIIGRLTTSPSTIAGFSPLEQAVATSADPLEMAFEAFTILQCQVGLTEGIVTVTEGFNTAFVDQNDDSVGPVDPADPDFTSNARPLFSPTPSSMEARNSRIHIVLTGLPSGVTITWPDESDSDSGDGELDSILLLVEQSDSGDEVTYVFVTDDQGESDSNGEIFEIHVNSEDNVELSGTPDDFGVATGQGQMFDDSTSDSQPRYKHPLEPVPGETFLTVAPCTTNLLYPWVLNFANADTGIAISNTSKDPYGTTPQTGTCTVNLYPTDKTTNNGVSAGGAVSITTAPVQPGSVWRTALSGTPAFAGLAGYIIAVCRFQYGHGFAFITDNFPNSPVTAQGYVALIIPDPVILESRSAAVSADDIVFDAPPYGEGLGQ